MTAARLAVYAPTPTGGHPEYIGALVGAMAELRPDARLVWPVRPDAAPLPDGSRIERPAVLPAMPLRSALSPAAWLVARLRPSARHDVAFLRWLRDHRHEVDAVLIEEYEPATLPMLVRGARRLGLPVAVHVHNVTPHGYTGSPLQRLGMRVARWGIAAASVVVVHTEANARAARRTLGADLPVRVIGHGIRPRRSTNPVASGDPRFVFFGQYRENKGLDVLVRALQDLPSARLTVAGPVFEEDVPRVAALLEPLGARVTWDRRLVPDADIDAVFDGATAAVLPYRAFEAQSGVLHLALEEGVPVVVSDAGGMAETTRGLGIGEVVPQEDPAALAAGLERVTSAERNAELRDRVCAAQETLSWESAAQQWWEALDGLLPVTVRSP
jgi:glycosyltransferase involved in cell wall biosynthesis